MKLSLIFILALFMRVKVQSQTITDIDGNSYNTITIGTQTWMQQNLTSLHFNNGDPIPTNSDAVNNVFESIYQWSYNDDPAFVPDYGRLYSWFAVIDDRNICPAGWHVPSADEWIVLSEYLGGDTLAGGMLKETGTSHWLETDPSVTNSSAFTALPGGLRGNPQGYSNIGTLANFWTSTPWGSLVFPRGYVFKLLAHSGVLEQTVAVGNCGLSVRCMQDTPSIIKPEDEKKKIMVFPNPVADHLNIQISQTAICKFSIYSVAGALLFQQVTTENQITLDLGFLSAGLYILQCQIGNNIIHQRIEKL